MSETRNSSNKQKVVLACPAERFPGLDAGQDKRLLARAEGGFCLLRAEACGAGPWPPHIPAAAPQQTPSRALSSANWSCEFEQKGNCVS